MVRHQIPRAQSFEPAGTGRGPQRRPNLHPQLLPAHPRGSTAPGTTYSRQAAKSGVFISHNLEPPRGQCWGQTGGEGSRAGTLNKCRDPKTWRGAMQRGDKSHKKGNCGRCGMPWVGDETATATTSCQRRALEQKDTTCSPGPWEQDEQEQVEGKRKKRKYPSKGFG